MKMVSRVIFAALWIWLAAAFPAMAQSHMDHLPSYKLDPVAPIYLYNSAGPAQFISAGTLATATHLPNVPPNATIAQICVETAGVRYRDDGANFYGQIVGTNLTVLPTSVNVGISATIGTIAVGQTINDPAGIISPGTTITGGSGTSWTVNNSQTVAPEIINAVTPPTANVGMPAIATSSAPICFQYTGPLTAVQFILISGSPSLDVSYYFAN